MSALPQRTKILVKDLIFQEKYNLSHTQTDLMAYLVNVTYWAISVDDYFVIATKKVLSDLPCLGEKTFEASLKALKLLGLIESTIVQVTQWNGNPKLRGIRLSQKGKEYNAKLILPNQNKELNALKKENQALKEALEKLSLSTKEEKKEVLEEKTVQSTVLLPKKEEIDDFIHTISQHFRANNQAICNLVPSYHKNTSFYINGYNRLAILTPSEYKQLSNPQTVNDFWQWLFKNPQRVGDNINFEAVPKLSALKKSYLHRNVKIAGQINSIVDFVKVKKGIKLKIKDQKGKERFVVNADTQKEIVFEFKQCQDIILKILV